MWLTGLHAPDHNGLWRFWCEHKKALRGILKQTVELAVHTGAVGFALQALAGTRIEAAGSGLTGWRKEYMEKLLTQLDAALEDIELKVVQENPQTEAPGYRLPAGLAERQARREHNGNNAARSSNRALPNSSNTTGSVAGRCGNWRPSRPSGPSYARRSTCGCSTKNGRPDTEGRPKWSPKWSKSSSHPWETS